MSHIPEKNGRRGANHAHRYTPAGGKQYAASLMSHHLNSAMLQSSNIIQSSINPVVIHQPKHFTTNPLQPTVASSRSKYFTHISKLMLENAITKTSANFYNTLPVAKTPKNLRSAGNKTELARLRSLPLPNSLSLVTVTEPKISSTTCISLPYTDIPKDLKNYSETASLTTKTVMYSTYHTLPITKRTATVMKGGPSSNGSSVVMEITGNICSSSLTDSNSVDTNPSGLSQSNASVANVCVGVKSSDDLESCATSDGLAWAKAPFTNNNALYPTAGTATKALNAVRSNISGNSIRETQQYGAISPSKRPAFLNLHSGGGGGGGSKHNKSQSKPLTNQSLPESPVCEDMSSPTALFHNLTDSETNIKSSRFVQQRRSCSYFIDLNTLTDNEQEFQTKSLKNVTKSSQSLPTTLSQANVMASSEENLLDSCDEEDGNGDFSSDSLEEPSEFSNRTPRRCVSDYQIFTRPPELVGYEFEQRSASAAGRQCKRSREAFNSQESILSNTSGQVSSCNNSGDILEMCSNYEQDRHSSASFFLSLRRRNMGACRSQESILTDESEYQSFSHHNIAAKYNRDQHRDSCRSTESILESDYHFSSMQRGNLAEYEHIRHRDSCQSTESILTDDSDCQVFGSCNQEVELRNRLFCSVENSGIKSKYELKHSEENKNVSGNLQQTQGDSETSNRSDDNHRPIFRTLSLQDTRSTLSSNECVSTASSSKSQTPSIILHEDISPLLKKCSERPTSGSLVRKNSYPHSRPQTPTSLQTHSEFSLPDKSYTTAFEVNMKPHSLRHESSMKKNAESMQEASESLEHIGETTEQHRRSSNRPPTAPKPTGKITHKPPLKPRQKPSQQHMKQRSPWNNQSSEISSLHSLRPLKANHSVGINFVSDVRKDSNEISDTAVDFTENNNRDILQGTTSQAVKRCCSEDPKNTSHTELKEKEGSQMNFLRCSYIKEGAGSHDVLLKPETVAPVTVRPGGVKLLCRSFENAVEDCDISDDCAEEDSFPVLGGSGSSTPATSSSAANSPKRLWPPASRAPNQRHLGKRLGTRHQILPSKCSGPGNMRPPTFSVHIVCSMFVCMKCCLQSRLFQLSAMFAFCYMN